MNGSEREIIYNKIIMTDGMFIGKETFKHKI